MNKNFIGLNKLTDEEFIKYYDELWNKTPHYTINWPSDERIKERKLRGQVIYNSDEALLKNEAWLPFPDNKDYEISSFGRIKYKGKFIKQNDKDENRPGYLVLAPENVNGRINRTREVYTFVAMTFLGKVEGDGLHVHHIDNNGYDCSTSNLILLTKRQHKAVHLDKHLNKIELVHFLADSYCEDRIKNHLSNYKLNTLNITECGTWKNDKRYSHVLPEELKVKNLISISYKNEFESFYKEIEPKLHMYFSHLTSSQALCFNLFYPLCIENKLSVINKSISSEAKFEFEHVEKNSFEQTSKDKEKTNFDFYIEDNEHKYFFEIKYTEQAFGSESDVKNNDKHDQKYKKYYMQQVKKIANIGISEKEFFDNYQIWRNICHADIGNLYFVFLNSRNSLKEEVEMVKSKCKHTYKDKIRILYIEDIVKNALKIKDERINSHYKEFYEKYLKGI